MSMQKPRDTRPELELRRALFARGLRYRVAYPVPGMNRCTIDIAFVRAKVAVMVDGCFWHRCPDHRTAPKSNTEWWERKLSENEARDRRVDQSLRSHGWVAVRVWEHTPIEEAVATVTAELALVNG